MARKLTGGFPPALDLLHGYVLRLTAVDPTTGALVSGVNVSNVAVMGTQVTPSTDDGTDTVASLEPLFIPLPIS
jgi:hypothetical protein